jgi:hypothetical protein
VELTPQEIKLVERLRKQNRQWKWMRWLWVVTGLLLIIVGLAYGYIAYLVASLKLDDLESKLIFSVVALFNMACLNFLFGVWCVCRAAIKWRGDINRILLLKLLDDKHTAPQ